MRQSGPRLFGGELGRIAGVPSPPSQLLKPSSSSLLAVTALKWPGGEGRISDPIPAEKGFTVSVHLKQPDASGWGTWIDGRFEKVSSWDEGGIGIYDLESNPRVLRDSPYESVHFNVPRATLNAFTDDSELPVVKTLCCKEGERDAALHHLAQIILPSLLTQQAMPDLFLDHFVKIFCSRLVSEYGSIALAPQSVRGGLAPWQKRRTLELLDLHLGGDLRLSRLAGECGLSVSYFCRCFRTSFGVSVHKFVIQQRVEKAKELLLESEISLADIAIDTGFSDQAAFSRTFGAAVGLSPAKWRMENQRRRKTYLSAATHSVVNFLKPTSNTLHQKDKFESAAPRILEFSKFASTEEGSTEESSYEERHEANW